MKSSCTSSTVGVVLASSVLALCGSASASTARILEPGTDYRENTYSGGEFRLHSVTGFNGNEDGAIIAGVTGFETFCLERNEFLAFGSTYGTLISDSAVFGGDSGGPADALDGRTAWLYEQFRAGTLSGYDFTPGAGRAASAHDLQSAIWFLEGENGGANNSYVADATAGALAAGYIIDLGGGLYQTVGHGSVQVLQLWDAGFEGQVGHQHQDVLMLVPLPPAGWAGLASLGGLMCLGYVRRRRLQQHQD